MKILLFVVFLLVHGHFFFKSVFGILYLLTMTGWTGIHQDLFRLMYLWNVFYLAFPSCLWPSAVHFVLQMAHNSLWQCLKPFIGDISPVVYRRKRPNRQAYLELCHRNPDILERVLNQIPLSNSTAWNCAPMQVVKQAEEQKWSSFQTNYDQ